MSTLFEIYIAKIIAIRDNIIGVKAMNRLKELRRGKGLTQTEFGQLWGASQNTVSNWENGNRDLSNDLLVMFAEYFGVSVDYLLGRDEIGKANANFTPSQEDKEILYPTSHLTPEEARVLVAYRAAEATYRKVALELLETHPASTPARQTLA